MDTIVHAALLVFDMVCRVMLPFSILGLFFSWHVVRPQKPPADTSNRINKIRLLWYAATKEGRFTQVFPWLTKDEGDNLP